MNIIEGKKGDRGKEGRKGGRENFKISSRNSNALKTYQNRSPNKNTDLGNLIKSPELRGN